jgi:hypothetical protein
MEGNCHKCGKLIEDILDEEQCLMLEDGSAYCTTCTPLVEQEIKKENNNKES